MIDELAGETRAIGFSQFLGECGDYAPTLAFLRGIGMGVALLWSGEGYLTG
jgi:hypothetical protein